MDHVLMHVGTPHEGNIPHSGRYPYGSGANPNQRPSNFLERIKKLEEQGLSEKDIAEGEGMSIRELRARKSAAVNEARENRRTEVNRLAALGYSNVQIGKELGLNESTVRSLRDISIAERKTVTKHTADLLRNEVDEKGYLDVGFGVAEGLGITRTRLDTAVQILKDEGYEVYNNFKVEQAGIPGQYTTLKVLCKPGTTFRDLVNNKQNIGLINERYKDPNGTSLYGLDPIQNISSDRVDIRYAEDGGTNKDGVIELRRGADGLSMGSARYAQVRIGVDGTHYLKGMAIYADDLPDGIDIRFNTNKHNTGNKLDALKEQKRLDTGEIDIDNPFGAAIKRGGQRGYLNIVNEEGDWGEWKKTLSSQMLSKQSTNLAKTQLDLAKQLSQQEHSDISALTNPVLKQYLLEQYADSCDRAAVHLKAAAMPRQGSFVILPLDTIKPTDIYAPKLNNGDSVVLIRYPHAGTFEIPRLRVNNNNKEAQRLFRNAQDAVGIHHSVAAQLSGADFDGDTVLVIPDNDKKILNSPALKKLQNFDPKAEYPLPKGGKVISERQKQIEMGVISNLITDMTLQGAPPNGDDIVKAVRHSMVVIDAQKHELDWKRSYRENDIEKLKQKYQAKDAPEGKKAYGGSATLISRSKSDVRVAPTKLKGVDRETGKLIFEPIEDAHYKVKTTRMASTDDARTLISKRGTLMEHVYADYANTMKDEANKARKEAVNLDIPKKSPTAAKTYAAEVESLDAKVKEAVKHQPYERKAQLMANYRVSVKKADNPSMTKEEVRKARAQALVEARARYAHGSKPTINITPNEWEAIQANAISPSRLRTILTYADQDALKQMAMPRTVNGLTKAQLNVARSMAANNYTQAEIAARLGVSPSTVSKALAE